MRRANRWVRILLPVLALASFIALGAGEAVPPNQSPAPALKAATWACYPTGVLPSDIVSADFDHDGWLELAVSCFGTGNVYFYDNLAAKASGVFSNTASLVTPVGGLPGAAVLAASDDGVYVLSDSMIPGTTPQLTTVPMGNKVPTSKPLASGTFDIVSADLDHERLLDDVVELQVFASSQVEDFSTGALYGILGIDSYVDAAIGDMNQDGWQDIVILTSNRLLIAYNCAGVGCVPVYLPPVVAANGNQALGIQNPTGVAVGDFDSDGLLDIVVVGNNPQGDLVSGYARVFLNTPAAVGSVFSTLPATGPMTTWGFNAVDVVTADLDGNGRDDFAVVNKGSDTVTVFLSDALATLQADDRATTERCLSDADRKADRLQIQFRMYKLELQCGHQPVAATVGDFDFNGKPDIAVALLSTTPEAMPQNSSCIEVLFDVACGFHQSGGSNVPGQTPHSQIPGVAGQESQTCVGCPPCSSTSSTESGSGN
jgi:hypothetical protein